MCLSPNFGCTDNLVYLVVLNSGSDTLAHCDYCLDDRRATHIVNRLDGSCQLMVTHCCGACAKGWRDIADQDKSLVV